MAVVKDFWSYDLCSGSKVAPEQQQVPLATLDW